MTRKEMPIFTRLSELLAWLVPVTERFPRTQRHTFTHRLLTTAFDLHDHLHRANTLRGAERAAALQEADIALTQLRSYLRLAFRFQWLNSGQYKHVAEIITEIGKLLGGWQKTTRHQPAANR